MVRSPSLWQLAASLLVSSVLADANTTYNRPVKAAGSNDYSSSCPSPSTVTEYCTVTESTIVYRITTEIVSVP